MLLTFSLLLPANSAQATERMTWDVDGLEREARVHLPDIPAGAPLVFDPHGHRTVGRRWQGDTQ